MFALIAVIVPHTRSLPGVAEYVWLGVDGRFVWVVLAAFLAGALNAVAGGGSFLSFPAMLGVGLGPIQANATNTVALWPGQLTSIAGYWTEVKKHPRLAVKLGIGGGIGGSLGAIVLLHTPAKTFMFLVPWLLLFAALIFALSGPAMKWIQRRKGSAAVDPERERRRQQGPWFLVLTTIVICFYIGYFGAGAGFLIISLLSLFGFEDLNEMNAMKVVSTTMANGIACILFAVSGKVEWRFCLAAMVTCGIGGYSSARIAQRANPKVLRAMVVAIGFGMAAYFFWRNHS